MALIGSINPDKINPISVREFTRIFYFSTPGKDPQKGLVRSGGRSHIPAMTAIPSDFILRR